MICPECGWRGAREIEDGVYKCTSKACGYEWEFDEQQTIAEENKGLSEIVERKLKGTP